MSAEEAMKYFESEYFAFYCLKVISPVYIEKSTMSIVLKLSVLKLFSLHSLLTYYKKDTFDSVNYTCQQVIKVSNILG